MQRKGGHPFFAFAPPYALLTLNVDGNANVTCEQTCRVRIGKHRENFQPYECNTLLLGVDRSFVVFVRRILTVKWSVDLLHGVLIGYR